MIVIKDDAKEVGSFNGQTTGSIFRFLIVRFCLWSSKGILKKISEEYMKIAIK